MPFVPDSQSSGRFVPDSPVDEGQQSLAQDKRVGILKVPDRLSSVVRNSIIEGAAAVPDSVLNAPSNLWNLGKSAYGFVRGEMGAPASSLPEVSSPPNYISNAIRNAGITKSEDDPRTSEERLLSSAIQGGVGMAAGGAPTKWGTGVISSLAGQGVKEAGGSDTQALAASLLAPTAARGINTVRRNVAENVMQHAVNPIYADLLKGKAKRANQTFLDEGVGPTPAGIERLKQKASGIGMFAEDALERNKSQTLDRNIVLANALQPVLSKIENKNIAPSALASQVEGLYDEIASNQRSGRSIPIQQANDFKRTLQQELKNKYGTLSEGSEAGKKALARELRLQIEQRVPEIAPINAQTAELWNAINVGERRALMYGNQAPVPLGSGIAAASGNVPVGVALAAQRNPWILSNIAHAINPMGGKSATLPVNERNRLLAAQLLNQQLQTQNSGDQ